jgi:Protein of unknown function (DUF1593)
MDRAQEKELKNKLLDPNNEVLRMNRRLLRSSRIIAILVANFLWGNGAAHGQQPVPGVLDRYSGHPRAFVISDIGNEPDDQMSFVRFLLYSNEIDVEGLVAATSTWQKAVTHPEMMHQIIALYGQVQPNLLKHASGWPTAAELDQKVASGQRAYGMPAAGTGKSSAGSQLLIKAADRDDPRPLWITIWGGANTLAQALMDVRATRSQTELAKFVAKLRVYSISDQDDAGPWIRREFPDLFYVVRPSVPNGEEYYYATWTGISGDLYYRNGAGADSSTVTNEWLDANIRSKGPLGKQYPKFAFIMEGDTPSYLGLINNGLASWWNPGWGGWGGRYVFRQPYGESHAIWTQGGDLFPRVTSQDTVIGADGKIYVSDQATIWRWREAFQHDFAARMDWTIKPISQANHNPIVVVNGQSGTEPIFVDAVVGQPIVLDASQSRDPDGQILRYSWFHYSEAGTGSGPGLAAVNIADAEGSKATITATATCRPMWIQMPNTSCPADGVAHIILSVTDNGSPTLTSYRRIVLKVHAQ